MPGSMRTWTWMLGSQGKTMPCACIYGRTEGQVSNPWSPVVKQSGWTDDIQWQNDRSCIKKRGGKGRRQPMAVSSLHTQMCMYIHTCTHIKNLLHTHFSPQLEGSVNENGSVWKECMSGEKALRVQTCVSSSPASQPPLLWPYCSFSTVRQNSLSFLFMVLYHSNRQIQVLWVS